MPYISFKRRCISYNIFNEEKEIITKIVINIDIAKLQFTRKNDCGLKFLKNEMG